MLNAPENKVAEILDGELFLSPRPAPRNAVAHTALGRLWADKRHTAEGMIRIRGVETLDGFKVRLALSDGTTREVDLRPSLNGPVFEPVRTEPAFFRAVRVDDELGTIVWSNGADIDPGVLIHGRIPASLETSKRSRAV